MATGARGAGAAAVAARVEAALAITWSELCTEFGASAVRTARSAGLITPVLPGIYSRCGSEGDFAVRAKALTVVARPTGAVTGLSAAHLWGVVDQQPARVTIQVPRQWHVALPKWARALRVPHAGPRYDLGGITLVSTPDAVVQSWREARPDVAAATVIAAIGREVTTASDLLEALARRKQMPRRGQLAELIGLVGNTVTSYLEYVAWREVFPPRLFPHLRWQVEIWPNGRKRVMDAFDPEAMLDLEFDGGGTHGGPEGFERDRERDRDMRSEGIEPVHYTYRDLTQRGAWCRQNYMRIRAARLGQAPAARAS